MKPQMSIPDTVERLNRERLIQFRLKFVPVSTSEAALVGSDFLIWFLKGRDGTDVTYYWIPNGIAAPLSYDLGRFWFLIRKPSAQSVEMPKFESFEEQDQWAVERLVNELNENCKDILRGEKEWRSQYEQKWGREVVAVPGHKRIRDVFQSGHAQVI